MKGSQKWLQFLLRGAYLLNVIQKWFRYFTKEHKSERHVMVVLEEKWADD